MSQYSIVLAIKELLEIVDQLRQLYPSKRFTLDGRLVGDLGEVIAETFYEITLHQNIQKHHDAISADGRRVQIKATMQKHLTFPCDHIPDYYLGIKVHPDGTFTEIFNGPGALAWEAVKSWTPTKNNLHTISIETLSRRNEMVPPAEKIPRRDNPSWD